MAGFFYLEILLNQAYTLANKAWERVMFFALLMLFSTSLIDGPDRPLTITEFQAEILDHFNNQAVSGNEIAQEVIRYVFEINPRVAFMEAEDHYMIRGDFGFDPVTNRILFDQRFNKYLSKDERAAIFAFSLGAAKALHDKKGCFQVHYFAVDLGGRYWGSLYPDGSPHTTTSWGATLDRIVDDQRKNRLEAVVAVSPDYRRNCRASY